jgi:RHS repeat-associated protein
MKTAFFILFSFFLLMPSLHADDGGPATSVSEVSDPDPVSDPSGNGSFDPDYFTGAATYRIPIKTPPGRFGIEPSLYLDYTSQRRNEGSLVGYGWEINHSYIQRSLTKGVPVYDDSGEFVFHSKGRDIQLIFVNATRTDLVSGESCREYRAKVDLDGVRYFECEKAGDLQIHWIAYDKKGTRYFYGSNNPSSLSKLTNRLLSTDPSYKEFRWYLDEERDTNDNYMIFYYQQLDGLNIQTIFYTAHTGSTTGSLRVHFDYQCDDSPHYFYDYKAGFGVQRTNDCFLDSIQMSANGVNGRKYLFSYTKGSNGALRLLQSVKAEGQAGDLSSAPPPITFGYHSRPDGWESAGTWGVSSTVNVPVSDTVDLVDMNGDGMPDRIIGQPSTDSFDVYTNTGTGFLDTSSWADIFASTDADRYYVSQLTGHLEGKTIFTVDGDTIHANVHTYLYDMNGDRLPDRVFGGVLNVDGAEHWGFFISYNNQDKWNFNEVWDDPSCIGDHVQDAQFCGVIDNTHGLMDLNGDGLPDRILGSPIATGDGKFRVYLNTGHGFQTQGEVWDDPVPETDKKGFLFWAQDDAETVFFRDMNGDGLLDRVATDIPGTGTPTTFNVFINTGHGWAFPVSWSDPGNDAVIDERHDLLDIDGDGLPDRIVGSGSSFFIYFNLGDRFDTQSFNLSDPTSVTGAEGKINFYPPGGDTQNQKKFTGFADMNGDGFLDRVVPDGGAFQVALMQTGNASLEVPNLLRETDNGLGLKTRLGYTPAARMRNRFLPFPVECLTSVKTTIGTETRLKSIDYAGGYFYTASDNPFAKRFTGFSVVRITDPNGQIQKLWYHQPEGAIRRHSRLTFSQSSPDFDVREATSVDFEARQLDVGLAGYLVRKVLFGFLNQTGVPQLISQDLNFWFAYTRSGARTYFPYLERQARLFYNGETAPKATASEWKYDFQTGNLTDQTEYGEVSWNSSSLDFTPIDGEKAVHIHTDYESSAILQNEFILDRPKQVYTTSFNDPLLRSKTDYLYETNGTGNLLKQTVWNYSGTTQGVADETLFSNRDAYGHPQEIQDSNGNIIHLSYDSLFHQYPQTRTVHVRRAPAGISKSVDLTTTTEFEPLSGKQSRIVDASGKEEDRVYDALGRLQEIKINNLWREKRRYFYNETDSARGTLHGVRTFTNLPGDPADDPDAGGSPRHVVHRDGKGRIVQEAVKTERGNYRVVRTDYEETRTSSKTSRSQPFFQGNAAFVSSIGAVSETFSDVLGRPIKINPYPGDSGSPTGPTLIQYSNGGNAWIRVTTDPQGEVRKEFKDGFGRTVLVQEKDGGGFRSTAFEYDFFGNLHKATDPAGHETLITYNSRGLKEELRDPDMGIWAYQYDHKGNLIQQTDPRGIVAKTLYDEADRPYGKYFYRAGNVESSSEYFYDTVDDGAAGFAARNGQLYKVTDSSGSTRFGYDADGYVNRTRREMVRPEAQSFEETVANNFDGTRANFEFPLAHVKLAYQYDAAGHLAKICEEACQAGKEIYAIDPATGFNAKGQILSERYGNETKNQYAYYPNSFRLKNITTVNGQNVSLRNVGYTYDSVSNLLSIQDGLYAGADSGNLTSLQYDDFYRLKNAEYTGADGSAANFKYDYNAIGNFVTNNESFGADAYQYTSTRPHAVTQIGSLVYAYDENGNLKSGGGRTMTYDVENHLSRVAMDNGRQVDFFYDSLGNRTAKKQDTNVTYYWGRDFEVQNRKMLHHIYAGDKRIATIARGSLEGLETTPPWMGRFHFRTDVDDDWPPATSTDYFYYYHGDPLGSSNLVTEGLPKATHNNLRYVKGDLLQRIEYTPFGKERYTLNATVAVDPRYTDQPFDLETGLYYYGARYYDPKLGRFIQPDNLVPTPFSSQGYNRYAYVLNNPLKYADPSGNSPENEANDDSEDVDDAASDDSVTEGEGTGIDANNNATAQNAMEGDVQGAIESNVGLQREIASTLGSEESDLEKVEQNIKEISQRLAEIGESPETLSDISRGLETKGVEAAAALDTVQMDGTSNQAEVFGRSQDIGEIAGKLSDKRSELREQLQELNSERARLEVDIDRLRTEQLDARREFFEISYSRGHLEKL